jgi:alpha-methylacyl-CoA racemase
MIERKGPLTGIKIVEFAGIGPGPHAAMMLADMGANVIRIDRKGEGPTDVTNIPLRSRRSIALNLKDPQDKAIALTLCEKADAIIEGFRPKVMERLGFAPEVLHKTNPKLVYGRMTGWGQTGPLAEVAGHDLNYIAITGALGAIGKQDEAPQFPLNLLGDFGGGSTYLVIGILAAILEAKTSGKGQVVDAAISDGVANLSSMIWWLLEAKQWSPKRESNFLDGGAHYYNIYATKDNKYISIGSIEPQFYKELRLLCGLQDETFDKQNDPRAWEGLKDKLTALFLTKSRDEWVELLEGTEVCFAPVLHWSEAPNHPHNKARETFVVRDGVTQPAPAPRFSRTPSGISAKPASPDEFREEVLKEWGVV